MHYIERDSNGLLLFSTLKHSNDVEISYEYLDRSIAETTNRIRKLKMPTRTTVCAIKNFLWKYWCTFLIAYFL